VLLSASYRQRQKYFAEKATSGIDKLIKEKDLTQQDIIEKSKEHHRRANRS
jgi:hypothetical protein